MTKINFQSAAKPEEIQEGSETISKESTPKGGSAMPRTCNDEGDDIVQKKTKAFIKKAAIKFGNKFDYSEVKYISAKTKVKIICSEHGEFYQTPDKHLHSVYGCPSCAKEREVFYTKEHIEASAKARQMTKDEFIILANSKYKNKYTYIIDKWDGLVKSTIRVICPIHGEFTTNARSHLLKGNSTGCPSCGQEHSVQTKTNSYSYVLNKMKTLYNNYYTYEEHPDYKNQRSKIKIYCPEHGEFIKSVQKHLSGQKCPDCTIQELIQNGLLPGGYCEQIFEDNPELKEKQAYLYYLSIDDGKYFKIGITTTSYLDRIKALKYKAKSFGHDIKLLPIGVGKMSLYNAYLLEQEILSKYSENRIYRKWTTELLNIDIFDEILPYLTEVF